MSTQAEVLANKGKKKRADDPDNNADYECRGEEAMIHAAVQLMSNSCCNGDNPPEICVKGIT